MLNMRKINIKEEKRTNEHGMCIFVCEYGEAKKATNDKTYSLKKKQIFFFPSNDGNKQLRMGKKIRRETKNLYKIKNLPKYEFRNV